jgi:enamine deaminase RidA (YjgF/YER057c/UK114 family)
MDDYASMNKVCTSMGIFMWHFNPADQVDIDLEMIHEPRPARTCVCVAELPFKTDVRSQSRRDESVLTVCRLRSSARLPCERWLDSVECDMWSMRPGRFDFLGLK